MTHEAEDAAKTALRIHMRGVRRTLIRDHPEADWQAGDQAEAMLAAMKISRPGVAAIYRATGNEMDPRPLAENLLKLGWNIALPACMSVGAPVVFRDYRPGDALAPDVMDIAAPLASAPEVAPDIIFAPVLAFDARGGRLGQGGGYYDRTMEILRADRNPPPFVGLAFAGQEVADVPVYDHDQRLDAVLTEMGYRPFL